MMKDRELRAESREIPASSNIIWGQDKQIWQRKLKKSIQRGKRRCDAMEAEEQTVFKGEKMVTGVSTSERLSKKLSI